MTNNRSGGAAIGLACLAVLGVTAGQATAATVSQSGGTISFAAAPGETNHAIAGRVGSIFLFTDTGVAPSPGSGCGPIAPGFVSCPAAGVTAVNVQLGDKQDTFDADTIPAGGPPFTVNGGLEGDVLIGTRGSDTFIGGGAVGAQDWVDYSARTADLTVTLDGVAGDGESGESDNVGADIDALADGSGDDTVTGNDNTNLFFSGGGGDTVHGLGAPDLIGGIPPALDGDDNYFGGEGDDLINGGGGNDLIDGGAGADGLSGDDGIDTVVYQSATAGVSVNLGTAIAQNTVGAGTDTLGGFENLTGSAHDDTLQGSDSDNAIEGAAGTDTINGAGGTDFASYLGAPAAVDVSIALVGPQNTGGAGTDTLNGIEGLTGSTHDDTLEGDGGDNTIDGAAGTDAVSYLNAAAAVDVSLAAAGPHDTGGAGSDSFVAIENLIGSSHDDTLEGDGGDNTIDGAAGTDAVSYLNAATAVDVSLALSGPQNTVGAGTDSFTAIEGVTGSTYDDTLEGNDGDNAIKGAAGVDFVSYQNATTGVSVNLGITAPQNTVGAGTDSFSGIEQLEGSNHDDTLTGTTGNDVIDGDDGGDFVDGRQGSDTMTGGPGNDTLKSRDGGFNDNPVDCGADTDIAIADETAPESLSNFVGCETVQRPTVDVNPGTPATFYYRANPGEANTIAVDLSASNGVSFTTTGAGEAFEDGAFCKKTGNVAKCNDATVSQVNVIVEAGDLDDTVTVTDSNPTSDMRVVLLGGPGDDSLSAGEIGDLLDGGPGDDQLAGGAGNDSVNGGEGSDALDGGPGADAIRGGSDGSGGVDSVDYSARSAAVEVSLDNASGDGEAGEGDDVGFDVEVLTGGSQGDLLIGNDRDNVLDGGPGDDTVEGLGGDDQLLDGADGADDYDGGSGNDTIETGLGDDTIDGGTGGDSISGGDGRDSVSYATRLGAVGASLDGVAGDGESGESDNLGADIEDLHGGQGSDSLTGNALPNTITGGTGNDVISGAGGADALVGDADDDQLDGGPQGDAMSGGGGQDRVSYASRSAPVAATLNGNADDGEAGESDSIGSDVETLVGGAAGDTLIGDETANNLIGGPGDDSLDGLAGFDLLLGGDGNDALEGGDDPDKLEGEVGDDSVDGSSGGDTIGGGAGADLVTGGSGEDIMGGGSGPDTLRARDGSVDVVSCGEGEPTASLDADQGDKLAADCFAPKSVKASLSISTSRLRASRRGIVNVSVNCKAQVACNGKLELRSSGRVRSGRRKVKLKLGSAAFAIPPGQTRKAAVKLPRRGARVLARLRTLRVKATATSPVASTVATLTVRAPIAKKRSK